MIVRELIEKLLQYDDTLEVVVRDYEGGYTKVTPDIIYISGIIEAKEEDKRWYYGDYEEEKKGSPALFIDYGV